MNLSTRWMAMASAVAVAGVVSAGAAMAAMGSPTLAPTLAPGQTCRAHHVAGGLQAAVASGKLTQAEADVMKQLFDLRKAAMDKLKTDEKAVVDQAVTGGKLTQAEADKLLQHEGMGGPAPFWGRHAKRVTHREPTGDLVKAKLEQAVKDGRMTQAEADERLQQFTGGQQQEAGETGESNEDQATPTPAGK